MPVAANAQLNTDRITAIGRNALYFEDYVLSIQYFNQVIKLKPYLAEPYQLRAIAKIQLSDYQGALSDCNAAIERNPFQPGAYYTRGYIYRQMGEMSKAEADFSEALVFAPENKTYLLLRADVLAQQQKYDSAQADIDYLLRRDPESSTLHFEKGLICLGARDTACALREFEHTVQYDSQNAANWSALGTVNLQAGNFDEAFADLSQSIHLGSKWAGDFINRGVINYRRHNYRAALADYEQAVSLAPREAQCYFNRGVLRQELGDYNNALTDFSQALDYAAPAEIGPIRYQRAMVNMQLGQWQDARSDLDSLIAYYPTFLPAYYIASRAATAEGQKKAAQTYLSQAYQIEQEANTPSVARDSVATPQTTTTMVAQGQTPRRDFRKEFSRRAAQNGEADTEEQRYQSATRGKVQNRYTDIVSEPNIVFSYYAQSSPLHYYAVSEFNNMHLLPSPLHATTREITLTAEMADYHFSRIADLSAQIDRLPELYSIPEEQTPRVAGLLFARALEFAIVQDYASALEDSKLALNLRGLPVNVEAIIYFCQANWRFKQLDYEIYAQSTQNISDGSQVLKQSQTLMLTDYDQVLRRLPDCAMAYYNKANILCRQKDYGAAIRHYTLAIELDADFAEAYFNRGLTYLWMNDRDKGIADLSKAGELGIYQAYNLITRFQ